MGFLMVLGIFRRMLIVAFDVLCPVAGPYFAVEQALAEYSIFSG